MYFCSNRGRIGDVVFTNPKTALKDDLQELERIDKSSSERKTTVVEDLTENLTSQMKLMRDNESREITTEKELTDKLSRVFLLDGDESEINQSASDDAKSVDQKDSSKEKPNDKNQHDSKTAVDSSAAEKLMQLIDERDALRAKLQKTDETKESSEKKRDCGSETSQTRSAGRGVVSSHSVLKNIHRVEAQKHSELDSDDEDGEISAATTSSAQNVPTVVPKCVTEMGQKAPASTPPKPEHYPSPQSTLQNKVQRTPFELIQATLKEWKTDATVEYLKVKKKKVEKESFEDKCEALGKLVSAKQIDQDLDDILDEEKEVSERC